MLRQEARRLTRFILVGVVNTAFGYILFLAFFFIANLSAPKSNALSYMIAVLVAFFIYRKFVFEASHQQTLAKVVFYLLSAAVAFSLNLAVLIALTKLGLYPPVAQIGAMATYTISFYLLNRFVVFRARS